jgi:hypothetical protein
VGRRINAFAQASTTRGTICASIRRLHDAAATENMSTGNERRRKAPLGTDQTTCKLVTLCRLFSM